MQLSLATPSHPRTPDINATIPSQTESSWAYTFTPTYTRQQCKFPKPDRIVLCLNHHAHIHQTPITVYTVRPCTPASNATIPSQTGSSWDKTITTIYTRQQCNYNQSYRVLLGLQHHAHVHQTAIQIYPAKQGPPGFTLSRPRTPDSNATISSQTGSSGVKESRPRTPNNNATTPSQRRSSWAYTIMLM